MEWDWEIFETLPDLASQLRELVQQIPPGRVSTYGALAAALGHSAASRWIGHYLRHEPDALACPCHRVVRSTGEITGCIAAPADVQSQQLHAEGVAVVGHRVRLDQCAFNSFSGSQPLIRLQRFQQQVLQRLSLEDREAFPNSVAGVDVSYGTAGMAVAACVVMNLPRAVVTHQTLVAGRVKFPYISSFLTFRELPLLLAAIGQARVEGAEFDALLVDGSGLLHPRRAGIATMLGVVSNFPTAGITKKLLCGSVNLQNLELGEARPVLDQEELLGMALRLRPQSARPLFVSPGHKLSVGRSLELIRQLPVRAGLPEPIYWADRLSRREVRLRQRASSRGGAPL